MIWISLFQLAIGLVAAFLVGTLVEYIVHRLMHARKFLYKIHAEHHQVGEGQGWTLALPTKSSCVQYAGHALHANATGCGTQSVPYEFAGRALGRFAIKSERGGRRAAGHGLE